VLNTEQESPTIAIRRRGTQPEFAIRIAEVENAGRRKSRKKRRVTTTLYVAAGDVWRMEERDGGVYVQNEAVS